MTNILPPRFINYLRQWDAEGQKWQKIPCDAQGNKIDPHHTSRWRSYDEAARDATWDETQPDRPYGVGFVLNGDGWFFYDLDSCLGPDGKWQAWAEASYLSFFGALGEVSTSGNGLHVLGRCDPSRLADRRRKWGKAEGVEQEFYTEGRFIALSPGGLQPIGGAYTDLDWTNQLLHLVPQREFMGELPDGRDPAYTGPEDDDELINAMLRSKNTAAAFGEGVTVKDLWEGNVEALARKYPAYEEKQDFDHSSADAALMSHLAFWTGKDMPRMDRLFRRSALMRDKYEKRADYRRDTIENAARLCKRVYDRKPDPAPAGPIMGFMTIPEMIEYFKGCIYVRDRHKVLVPTGELLKPEQFKASYGGCIFPMDHEARKTTSNAFEALTECRVHKFPQARTAVFHPDLPFQAFVGDGVNTYLPAEVFSEPGDIGFFWDWFGRLLPVKRDRRILMGWSIDLVQNPGKKMLWSPVLQGAEGNGKSTMFEILAYAIGEQYCHTARSKELSSTFNGWQVGKLLAHVPEVHMGGRRELLDDLKPNITDYRIPIRQMHQVEANCHVPLNWCFTTNYKNAVIKSRMDRRYATLFTAQQSKADVERDFPENYMSEFWDWLRDVGFARVTHYLRTAPPDPEFSPMNGCVRAPETSSNEEAIEASTGGVEAEIIEAVESGSRGFSGGWISSWALDRMLRDRHLRISRPQVAEILTNLGYQKWGRAPRPILQEDHKRPELWCKGLTDSPFEDYLEAQSSASMRYE